MTTTHERINTLRFDPRRCSGCRMCIAVCPHGVFAADGPAVRLDRPEVCMECGACRLNCPEEAVTVESGVGCAYALMRDALTGGKGARCGCGDSGC